MLWPPNHSYVTINLTQCVSAASDGCDPMVNLSKVFISQVSSDEPEDAPGGSDGNTTNDIVIAADCKSVQLRAERNENGNGRVYTITFKVRDASGNTGTATFNVTVQISQNGNPAVPGPGPGYTKTSNCQ
jgi:hypothetical protein